MLKRVLLLAAMAWFFAAMTWAQAGPEPLDEEIPAPPASAETLARLAEIPKPDATPAELRAFYSQRANEARRFGLVEQESALLAKLADLVVGTPQEGHFRLRQYGLLLRAGRLAEAVKVRDAFLSSVQPLVGAKASLCFFEATFRASLWEMAAARKYFDLGVDFLRRLPRAASGNLALLESRRHRAQSTILLAEGKLAAAETAIRKALALNQSHLEWVTARADHAEAGDRSEQIALAELDRADMLASLVEVLLGAGRPFAAEVVANDWRRRAQQPGHPANADILSLRKLGDVRLAQGRFGEALVLYDQLVSRMKALGLGEKSVLLMRTQRQRARALIGLQRWQEAAAEFDHLAASAGSEISLHRAIGGGPARALALLQVGRGDEALSILGRAQARFTRQLGREHPDTASVEGLRAAALQKAGRRDEALAAFRHAVPILMRPDPSAALRDEHPLRRLRLQYTLAAYIELLYQQYREEQKPSAADEAFRVADFLRGSRVQEAIVASTGRLAAGDGALATLIRAEQDRRNEIATLYGLLSRQQSGAEIVPGSDLARQLRQRIETAEKEHDELTRQLRERFPAYAELVNPRPPALSALAQSLAPGEAFLAFLTTPDRTYGWATDRLGKVAFFASDLGETKLAEIVTRLRRSLDPDQWRGSQPPPFDHALARQVFGELLAPTKQVWQERPDIVVAASGSLGRLPFALLPMGSPEPRSAEKPSADWLVASHSITQTPSAAAFAALRALPRNGGERPAFLGFGDPDYAAAPLPVPAAEPQPEAIYRETLPWPEYRKLPRLPETRDEILAIAAALQADPAASTFFGRDASRARVQTADLSRRRVVAFATHGLVPGDLPGLDQPALALAGGGDARESPLLTLGDVLGLRLDADWVVLSACNTASPDAAGAEAVSGLGRGFFYAGTRAVLVTHWSVESESAKLLVSEVFRNYAKPDVSRAQALRLAQLQVMQQTGKQRRFAHPAYWAGYALVGDGGR